MNEFRVAYVRGFITKMAQVLGVMGEDSPVGGPMNIPVEPLPGNRTPLRGLVGKSKKVVKEEKKEASVPLTGPVGQPAKRSDPIDKLMKGSKPPRLSAKTPGTAGDDSPVGPGY